jgi:hypothetical protein
LTNLVIHFYKSRTSQIEKAWPYLLFTNYSVQGENLFFVAMPSAVPPELPQWKPPAKTKANLDWADIALIDISSFDEPGEKQRLAEELRNAVCFLKVFCGFTITNNIGRFKRLAFSALPGPVLPKKKLQDNSALDRNFLNDRSKRRISRSCDAILERATILDTALWVAASRARRLLHADDDRHMKSG